MRAIRLFAAALALLPVIASAAETILYKYDAKGRIIQVSHSGSANNNVVTNYTFDTADNRTNKQVTGAP